MGAIKKLDISVSNKIAAGEVVERPASVVKELVENSIDAGSTSITVEIKDGGIQNIRVVDNGGGISASDAVIAFDRHTTSKIEKADDLNVIITMGFRGEALSSIAAVSQVELTSRTADSDSGFRVINHGGIVTEAKEYASPEGTVISVNNLFYNTPARRKFLKKPSIEASYITDIMSRYILGYPEISFRYIVNRETVYFSPGDGDALNALCTVYGYDARRHVIEVNGNVEAISLRGYLGDAEMSRPNRTQQSLFVNGRYIKDGVVSSAVQDAYGGMLMIGRFPLYVLELEINPEFVDVNVHPNKLEIKFSESLDVAGAVYKIVSEALAPHMRDIGSFFEEKAEQDQTLPEIIETVQNTEPENEPEDEPTGINNMMETEVVVRYSDYYDEEEEAAGAVQQDITESNSKSGYGFAGTAGSTGVSELENPKESDNRIYEQIAVNDRWNSERAVFEDSINIIGTLFLTYIIVEYGEKAYIIDQHAAHERLLYEKFKKNINDNIVSQKLLLPIILPTSGNEDELIEENKDLLHEIGFELSKFGARGYKIESVPVIFGEPAVKAFFSDFLAEAGRGGFVRNVDMRRAFVMQLACKKAVKGNARLKNEEISALLKLLKNEEVPLTCPHGRPVMLEMSKSDIEKRFKRKL